jgi:hypothetical protein
MGEQITTGTTKAPNWWQVFLTGLAGPAAGAAAGQPRQARPLSDLVEFAKRDLLQINTLNAIDALKSEREIDEALGRSDARRQRLRVAFDAMADLVAPGDRSTALRPAEMRVLLNHVVDIAPDATAQSVGFRELVAAVNEAAPSGSRS